MKVMSSILVVIDRSPASRDALAKAILLAWAFASRIELFMCDAERAYALSHAYVSAGVEEARGGCVGEARLYLEELKASMSAPDVDIHIDAVCESPLYESIVHKALRSKPDLVIKCAGGSRTSPTLTFDANDWQLMRSCPTALMLTRGRQWRQPPKLAAAVDISPAETTGLARDIVHAAHLLTRCAGGEFDVIYVEPENSQGIRGVSACALQKLTGESPNFTPGVHVLSGVPEEQLPAFARLRGYDALLLGALAHRPGLGAVGSLTSKLVEALDCDFILVKADNYQGYLGPARPEAMTASTRG